MSKDYVFLTAEDTAAIGVISVLDATDRSGVLDLRHKARYFGLKRKLCALSDMDLLVYELSKAMDTARSNVVIVSILYFDGKENSNG